MTKKEMKKVFDELMKDNDKVIFSFKDTNGNNIGKVKVPIDSTNEEIEKLLKENSGLLSRMKERDGNEKLNKICEENFKKDLTNSHK